MEKLPETLSSIDPEVLETLVSRLGDCITKRVIVEGEINRLGQEHESYRRLKQESEDLATQVHVLLEGYTSEQRHDLAFMMLYRRAGIIR